MAKKQINAWIDDAIVRLVQEAPGTTGATMTRHVQAALLQYLFSFPHGPSERWMRAALAVEEGRITVGEVPLWLARTERDALKAELDRIDQAIEAGQYDSQFRNDPIYKEIERQYRDAAAREFAWGSISGLSPDASAALLTFWERSKAGLLSLEGEVVDGVMVYGRSSAGWTPTTAGAADTAKNK